MEQFAERTNKITKELEQLREPLRSFGEQALPIHAASLEVISMVPMPEDLSEVQREGLLNLALFVATAESKMRQQEKLCAILDGPDVQPLRRAIVGMCSRHTPRLPKDAWAWIIEESDIAVLRTLLCTVTYPIYETDFASVRRALFVNRALCVFVTAASRDEQRLQEVRDRFGFGDDQPGSPKKS